MKALSLRQPWVWLVVNGGKDIENRDWSTDFRGRVLLHASKSGTRAEFLAAWGFAEGILGPKIASTMPAMLDYDRGGIVGSIEIVDCVTESDSPWFVGPFGFVLRDFQPLQFRPYKGALGLFDVEDETP